MKISVITPSVRQNGLDLVKKSLDNQTETDFEWLVSTNYVPPKPAIQVGMAKKSKKLFYTLNRDYNTLLKKATGELVISYQDLIEVPPDCLEKFWFWYKQLNGKGCVGAVGDQYVSFDPLIKVWQDPRKTTKFGSFYEINPIDIEFTLCAIPRQAFLDAGGFDEEYDKGAGVGEKELCLRLDKLGYKFYLDQTLEYKAQKHPRLTNDWDKYYEIANNLYFKHLEEIVEGTRQLKLDYL